MVPSGRIATDAEYTLWRRRSISRLMGKQVDEWAAENRHVMATKIARNFHSKLIGFLVFSGILVPTDITTAKVQTWVNHLSDTGLSPQTVRSYKCAINSFCKYCLVRGQINHNPCQNLKLPPRIETLPRYLTDEQIVEVFELARRYNIYLEVLTALKTGMRLTELREMCWEHILFDRNLILVPKSKIRKPRSIPLHSELKTELRKHIKPKGPVFPKKRDPGFRCTTTWLNLLKPIQKAMPEAFLEGTSPMQVGRCWYIFRHTFATRLAMAGVSIYKISKYMGHANVKMTERYAHYIPVYDEDIEKA